jgi:hypothetical protein
MMTGSGRAARAPLLTLATATAAVETAALVKKCRRCIVLSIVKGQR